MSRKSGLIRSLLIILAFFGVLSVGVLIGQEHAYHRHLHGATDSLRSARHSVNEALRDRGGNHHARRALELIDSAMREVQEALH